MFRIQDFIDAQETRPVHFVVLGVCMLVMFIDGLDIFMVGKIAPAIARGLGETPAAMTWVFLLQQIGLAVGAFAATPLADRFGRRRMLIICSAVFGVLTLATSLATTIGQLAVLRGLAGVFLSGGLPMAVALLSELAPRAKRGTFIAVSFVAYSAGSAAGGAIAAWLIDAYGWQSGFWVGGVLPLISVPLMLLLVPESPHYLVTAGASRGRIAAVLRRLQPRLVLTGEERFVADDGSRVRGKASLFDIFRDGRARVTTILWLACVLSMGTTALMAAWMPTFFQEMAGIPIQRFAVYSMIAYAGGMAGTLTMGWLIDRVPAGRLIPPFYFALAACIALLGVVPFEASLFIAVLLGFNFAQTGGQTGLNTLMARIYPASMRSTGLGWAGGAGRIGGIIAPLFGGLAVASHASLQTTMLVSAAMPLLVGVLMLLVREDRAPAPPIALSPAPAS